MKIETAFAKIHALAYGAHYAMKQLRAVPRVLQMAEEMARFHSSEANKISSTKIIQACIVMAYDAHVAEHGNRLGFDLLKAPGDSENQ